MLARGQTRRILSTIEGEDDFTPDADSIGASEGSNKKKSTIEDEDGMVKGPAKWAKLEDDFRTDADSIVGRYMFETGRSQQEGRYRDQGACHLQHEEAAVKAGCECVSSSRGRHQPYSAAQLRLLPEEGS